jgi:hypothetical protein
MSTEQSYSIMLRKTYFILDWFNDPINP